MTTPSNDPFRPHVPPVPLMPPPRNAQLRRKVKVMWMCIATAFLVVAGAFYEVGERRAQEFIRLRDHGVKTKAIVIDKSISRSGKSTTRNLKVEFTPPSGVLRQNKSVARDEFESIAIGQELPLTYDPKEPTTFELFEIDGARIESQRQKIYIFIACIFGLEFIVGGGFTLMMARRLRLLRDGLLVKAKVVSIGEPDRKNKLCKIEVSAPIGAGRVVKSVHYLKADECASLRPGSEVDYLVDEPKREKGELLSIVLRSAEIVN